MSTGLVFDNLLTAPILFFLLGLLASLLRSDLEIPTQVGRFISLYLLFAIGFHGGHELSQSVLEPQVIVMLLLATATSVIVPLWSFALLRLRLGVPDAAAIAATYGSVSAVTFITAVGFLNSQEVPFGGYMVAAMALMESPAIVVGVLLARFFGDAANGQRLEWRELGREAFLNGSVLILLGSLAIGVITGEEGWQAVKAFAYDPFKGILCLFLLEMGLLTAKRLRDLRSAGAMLVGFALGAAIVHATLGIWIAWLVGASKGDALLLAVLVGGASYIAVPAAVRLAIPAANPSLYVPMALGITFPFNVVVGIPLYFGIIQVVWS